MTHSARNWFLSNFLITPYFDQEFSRSEFITGLASLMSAIISYLSSSLGAKSAIEMVSSALAAGELDPLVDIIDPECLEIMKRNLSFFTLPQREALKVNQEDIYTAFLYQIGILMEDIEQKSPGNLGSRHN